MGLSEKTGCLPSAAIYRLKTDSRSGGGVAAL